MTRTVGNKVGKGLYNLAEWKTSNSGSSTWTSSMPLPASILVVSCDFGGSLGGEGVRKDSSPDDSRGRVARVANEDGVQVGLEQLNPMAI